MARQPTVGGDNGGWGSILNAYLSVAHSTDGTLLAQNNKIGSGDATVPDGLNAFGLVYNGNISTPTAGGSAWGFIAALNFTKSASGTHPVAVSAEIDFPHIFGSGATITEISALRVGADGAAPYSAATKVYGLHVQNGVAFCGGGDAASVARPGVLLNNNQILTWLDNASAFTNAGFLWLNTSNDLLIGTGGTSRFKFTHAGGLLISATDPGFADVGGRLTQPNNALHLWVDAAGGSTNSGFIFTDNVNTLNLGAGNTTRLSITSGGTITFLGYGGGTGAVSVGAVDSGGAGFRLLRVPN
jgi:hypothetical protein